MGSNIEPIPRTLKPVFTPENTAPQRIWQRIHFSLSVNVYLSSAYELAKDPSLSFPAMEAESMVMSGFIFKERCQASAESEYSTCPTRLFHQTSSFKEQQPCKPNRTLFPGPSQPISKQGCRQFVCQFFNLLPILHSRSLVVKLQPHQTKVE